MDTNETISLDDSPSCPISSDEQCTNQTIPAKKKGVVDIVFLIDATGSMGPCIKDIKKNIHLFVETLGAADANGGVMIDDWRASVCAYRDYDYDVDRGLDAYISNPFTSDVDELRRQLSSLDACGGGDEPESLLDALYELIQGREKTDRGAIPEADKWRYTTDAARCVIIFTDASFHPNLSLVPSAGVEDIIQLATSERIRLSVFAPEMSCYYELSMLDKSNYEAIEVPEGSTPVKALSDFTSDKANFEKTLIMLAKSVSASGSADIEAL